MKSRNQKSLALLVVLVSLFATLQIPAMAAEEADAADVEQTQLSADESATLDLDSLMDATELDQSAAEDLDTQESSDDSLRIVIGPSYRPRPYPVYVPRPIYSPYEVCFARDAYGRTFRAAGYNRAGQLQRIALNSCYRSSGYGCRPVGCRR